MPKEVSEARMPLWAPSVRGKRSYCFTSSRSALANGLLPVYILAEHLFAEILVGSEATLRLPSQVAEVAASKIIEVQKARRSKTSLSSGSSIEAPIARKGWSIDFREALTAG